MLRRCLNEDTTHYPSYGGRGIAVCPEWRESFEAFLEDMGPRPDGFTLDRIDPDGDYAPGNCRWADVETQTSNRRSSRFLTMNGETLTVSQWARRMGCKSPTLHYRLRRGWSVEKTLTTPVGPSGPKAGRKEEGGHG